MYMCYSPSLSGQADWILVEFLFAFFTNRDKAEVARNVNKDKAHIQPC